MAAKKSKAPAKPKQYTKAEFLKAVSDKTSMTQADLDKALGGILEQIKNILAKGESIAFLGFGKFEVSERAARDGRNPQTGEKLKIPASKAVKFSSGKDLKEAVNKKKKK
jgi:DNA-binding protein HU-beta